MIALAILLGVLAVLSAAAALVWAHVDHRRGVARRRSNFARHYSSEFEQ